MWISIEDELPMSRISDLQDHGFRIVRCKFTDENIRECGVGDHHSWYFDAKKIGVTHWWKGDPNEVTAKSLGKD